MRWVYGVEAVFGRFAADEATGAVVQEDYPGGEQGTGYAVVSHQGNQQSQSEQRNPSGRDDKG